MRWGLIGAVSVWLLAGGSPAWACGDGKVLFSDSFDTLQSAWGEADDHMNVSDGKLRITENAGKSYSVYAGPTFDDIDLCAKIKLVDTDKPSGAYGGIMFWAKDLKNFYTFQITLDGYATVYQKINDEWKQIIKDREADSIHQGTTRFNEIEVVTRGHQATFYINGEHFDDIAGLEPDGGQHIGFTMEAPDSSDATFDMDDVTVNAVSE